MNHFEVTIRPLSEKAKKRYMTEVIPTDAIIANFLQTEDVEGSGLVKEHIRMLGGPDVWLAFVSLVKALMESYPQDTSVALQAALEEIKDKQKSGLMN